MKKVLVDLPDDAVDASVLEELTKLRKKVDSLEGKLERARESLKKERSDQPTKDKVGEIRSAAEALIAALDEYSPNRGDYTY